MPENPKFDIPSSLKFSECDIYDLSYPRREKWKFSLPKKNFLTTKDAVNYMINVKRLFQFPPPRVRVRSTLA